MIENKTVIGVDLDGVCADFYGRMREIASEWLECSIDELPGEVSYGLTEWGISGEGSMKASTGSPSRRGSCSEQCRSFPVQESIFASFLMKVPYPHHHPSPVYPLFPRFSRTADR